jgi:sugar phosphate isomerase/epimerase
VMHKRISLHQVAFMGESTGRFIGHCRAIGVQHMTLVTPKLMAAGELDEAVEGLVAGGPRVATVNHVFAVFPDLATDHGMAAQKLHGAIDIAARLGADAIYLLSGGRGSLDWEGAAERFAGLIAPCLEAARARGLTLLVENANSLNADIHIAHTLPDAIRLAEIAGIGLCMELHACWMEAGLRSLFRRAMPITGLVQVSDYVLGDRTTPCRAVPGDGVIPLERLIGDLLEAGYTGLFDLELVGPRIAAEGAAAASTRAAERLSEILVKLGAT